MRRRRRNSQEIAEEQVDISCQAAQGSEQLLGEEL